MPMFVDAADLARITKKVVDVAAALPDQPRQQLSRSCATASLEPYRERRGNDSQITVLAILRASSSNSRFQHVKQNIRDYVSLHNGPFQLIAIKDGMSTSLDMRNPRVAFPVTLDESLLFANLDRVQSFQPTSNNEGFSNFLHKLSVNFHPSALKKVVVFCADAPVKQTMTQPLSDAGVAVEILNAYSELGRRLDVMRLSSPKIELGLALVLPDDGRSAYLLKHDAEFFVKIRVKNIQPGKVLEVIFDETPYFERASMRFPLPPMLPGGDGSLEYRIRLLCKHKDHYSTSWHAALKLLPQFMNIRVLKHGVFSKPKLVETDVPGFCLQPRHFLGHILRRSNSKLNVLILGQKGAGKSSFVNSSLFLLRDENQSLAMSSAESDHVTLGVEEFDIRESRSHLALPFRFYDSRGVSESNYRGDEVALLCNGQMPLGVDWAVLDREGNGSCVTNDAVSSYVKTGGVRTNEQPDVVLFLLSPTVLDDSSQMAKYKAALRAIERTGRQVVTAISRMDTAIDYREREDYVSSCKRFLSIDTVLPLINYTSSQCRRRFEVDQFLAAVWIALHKAASDFRARTLMGREQQQHQHLRDHRGDMPALSNLSVSLPPREVRHGGSARWAADLSPPATPTLLGSPAAPAVPPIRSNWSGSDWNSGGGDTNDEISEFYSQRALSASSGELRQFLHRSSGNQSVGSAVSPTPPSTPPLLGASAGDEPQHQQHAALLLPQRQSGGERDSYLPSYNAVQAGDAVRGAGGGSYVAPPRTFFNVGDSKSAFPTSSSSSSSSMADRHEQQHRSTSSSVTTSSVASSTASPSSYAGSSASSSASRPPPRLHHHQHQQQHQQHHHPQQQQQLEQPQQPIPRSSSRGEPPLPVPPAAVTEGEFFDRALRIACIAKDIRVQQDMNLALVHQFSRRGIQYQEAFLKAYSENVGDRDGFMSSLRAATENMMS
ncbi:hypothetical protein HDU87_003195 [Geranomyces variabilis]|uniref:Uncharacterized protein n=1 Tax=Geranomyces variabilis TaxID=109894 RepID=A0AAD5TMH0_9FUNG|nr:hypothetical protein HDU87_003195 [Geranomyces variabilis]